MASTKGIELKGGMYTFMSLKLLTADLTVIDQRLSDKVQQAPSFFRNTPVVVDLSVLEEQNGSLDGDALLACIRKHDLVPIVASISDKSSPLASSFAIPLVEGSVRRTSNSAETSASPEVSAKPSASPAISDGLDADLSLSRQVEYIVKTPMLVDKPVRSGQQVYARDTDLIIMGQVGPGAEVIADNNIHIYGPLRGRALCGVSGNTSMRIYCQSLEAELVSVAGNYRMLETIPEDLRGKPAQIWLDNDRLNIEPL